VVVGLGPGARSSARERSGRLRHACTRSDSSAPLTRRPISVFFLLSVFIWAGP
jgi:hypothetical protein